MDELLGWIHRSEPKLAFQVAVSVICGGIVGLERQRRGKAIGIRTSMLICLATMVFVRLGEDLAIPGSGADPTRVLGQVVTGVGFLGAGVILARGGTVVGVTSAAVVWMLAAIGSTIGVGRAIEALTLSGVVVAVLIGVRMLEHAFNRLAGASDEPDTEPSPPSP